jgi:hypothetical protein
LHTQRAGNLWFALWFLGAFFAAKPQKTGLSAPIYFAALRKFRFNPFRRAEHASVFSTVPCYLIIPNANQGLKKDKPGIPISEKFRI